MSLQAVLFNKNYNTPRQADKWLHQHNLRPIKERHTTANFHRYRIAPPTGQMRMLTLDPRRHIRAVIIKDHKGGSLHMPTWRQARRLYRRRGGAIGSDLGVGAAVVGSILAGILGKKIYDHFKK